MTAQEIQKIVDGFSGLGEEIDRLKRVAVSVHIEREKLRTALERLKQSNYSDLSKYVDSVYSTSTRELVSPIRPEPSRLEIAATLKAGWLANPDSEPSYDDPHWWLNEADKLIKAANQK